jgi:ubiquinone/menaquinone biosynthesis C-methylase UbiE
MSRDARLYGELAKYYDRIYHWKDYQREARTLKRLIRRYKRSSGNSLLDVACGTGNHIKYLRTDFNCTGVDSSEQMLAVARRNVRGTRFMRGKMTDFKIRKQFDVILCLFSSIGYLKSRREIQRTFFNFSKHLKKGGVLIVEPWLRKSEWRDGTVHMQRYVTDSLIIARVNYGRADRNFSILDERYLIAQRNKGIRYVKDRHRMRFFELAPTLEAMRKAGLNPEFTKHSLMAGRGLLIATKPK